MLSIVAQKISTTYTTTVRTHRSTLSLLESFLLSVSDLLPQKFDDDDSNVELVRSFVSLVGYFNDWVCYGDGNNSNSNSGIIGGLTVVDDTQPSPDPSYSLHLYSRGLISFIECIELVCEKLSGEASFKLIDVLESVKAFCRLLLLAFACSGRLESGAEMGLLQGGGGLVPGVGDTKLSLVRKHRGEQVKGKRKGKVYGTREVKTDVNEDVHNHNHNHKHDQNKPMIILGEVLHILRPVTAHKLRKKYGDRSMWPFVAGLGMDVLSHKCSLKGVGGGGEGEKWRSPQRWSLGDGARGGCCTCCALRFGIFSRGGR